MAWKDHTSIEEAEEITGAPTGPNFWRNAAHLQQRVVLQQDPALPAAHPKVFEAAYTWVECADWIPAMLTDNEAPGRYVTCVCAAGHKAMYNDAWGGYPDAEFLSKLDPALGALRQRLNDKAYAIDTRVGGLSSAWAKKTGLPEGIPVAAGAFDAHLGAVGAGIRPGIFARIVGTSTCDMAVASMANPPADIPGLCGIVPGSILPGAIGLEAGQSAVGDIFNWFVNYIQPGGPKAGSHEALTKEAAKLAPGASGLLALDWNNGNRTILVDQRLTGLLLGQTLYTTPAEIYRALIEATGFGALTIINRFEEYGVPIRRVINCGGIAEKNPLVMQIYADIMGRTMEISRSAQTCALGAAIAGAVVAGKKAGGYSSVAAAQKAMTGLKAKKYTPEPKARRVYQELYPLYKDLHDALGTRAWSGNLHHVMKRLLEIRAKARK